MTITTLASGSSGNAVLLSHGSTHVLVDAGISARRIKLALAEYGLTPADLAGVCITHAHSDHISGLATLSRNFDFPLYATAETGRQLCYRLPLAHRMHDIIPDKPFVINGFEVLPVSTTHDCPGSVGYSFAAENGRRAAVVTDLGTVTEAVRAAIRGVDAVVVETNHDLHMLANGGYPYHLQRRISGDCGHLSNEAGAALARYAAECGAHSLILAHLSAENNTPGLALAAVGAELDGAGIARGAVSFWVAPRSEAGKVCEV